MSASKKRATGRPKGTGMQIDLKQVTQLAVIACTDQEIAAVMGVTDRTIRRWKDNAEFAEALERGRAQGRATLRRMQWKGAEAGNPTMLIWLGKQLLGQADKIQQEVTGKEGAPIAVDIVDLLSRRQILRDTKK